MHGHLVMGSVPLLRSLPEPPYPAGPPWPDADLEHFEQTY